MCPDRKMISLYLDGELPSPWKEKLETHLGNCTECRAALTGYRQLGETLRELPEETVQAAQERVWKRLSETSQPVLQRKKAKRLWNRTITLPLPAAAAAAALIIVVFLALMGMGRGSQSPSQDMMATNIGLDEHGMVPIPIQDMSGILQYLSSQNNGDFMVIRLPESRSFSRVGEPALINAADYSRRNAFR